ncbi:TPA: hypothetical protein ISX28_002690 [Listeria monocytogenes]|nr:hypothetical protein [Listeria monocytogenes]HAP2552158.1 hypothetical protein [Listeria monocytogenes]HAP2558399.1 hypothetical protein [Listeria monocytogenes]HAP2563914.1 hypothetical protein [Listeria monocytogenes]HAP2570539.1 hypothetical protein [Listeria monocytogenes]HAP2580285.1 hypothetical protein [Listeria monocytogenes]
MKPIEFKAQNVNGVWVCGNFSILKKKIGNVGAEFNIKYCPMCGRRLG